MRGAVLSLLLAGCSSIGSQDAVDGADHSDAGGGADPLVATCGGSVTMIGATPLGAFAATAARSEIAVDSAICKAGINIRIADDVAGLILELTIAAWPVDGGHTLVLGERTVPALLFRIRNGPATTSMTTIAAMDLTAADAGALSICGEHLYDPSSASLTGALSATIALSQDGFALTGTVTLPYCACRRCWDSV
jgi:hypothetical protein